MDYIVLPHANSKRIELNAFLAAWIQYCALVFANTCWSELIMPINNAQLAVPTHAGLDQLCRILAGRPYLHTMQATQKFFARNSDFIEKIEKRAQNLQTRRMVNGAKLKGKSIELWNQLGPQRSELLLDAERFLTADQEYDDTVVGALSADIAESASGLSVEPLCAKSSEVLTDEDVNSLVNFIHQKPFQPYYKKQAHGRELTPPGWKCRHDAYFWPHPGTGADLQEIGCFAAGFRRLVERIDIQEGVCPTLDIWCPADGNTAIELANKIFKWGGVREKDPL